MSKSKKKQHVDQYLLYIIHLHVGTENIHYKNKYLFEWIIKSFQLIRCIVYILESYINDFTGNFFCLKTM